jgi:hypothetical protein
LATHFDIQYDETAHRRPHDGLIDHTWLRRFPAELAARLQQLLDNPNA